MAEGSPENATFRVSSGAVRFFILRRTKEFAGSRKKDSSFLPLPYARQFCGSLYSLSFRSFDFILDPNYPLKSFRSSYTFVYVEFQTTGQTNKLYVTFIVDSLSNLVVI